MQRWLIRSQSEGHATAVSRRRYVQVQPAGCSTMSPLNQLYDLSRFVVMPVSHNAIGASTIIWPVPTIDFGVQHTLGMELPSDIGSYQESSAKPRVRSQVASPSPGPDVDSGGLYLQGVSSEKD